MWSSTYRRQQTCLNRRHQCERLCYNNTVLHYAWDKEPQYHYNAHERILFKALNLNADRQLNGLTT